MYYYVHHPSWSQGAMMLAHKEQTRQRVISEAAAAIRRKGPERVPVSEIMAAAGLTHGGFYAHLRSKDDVVAQAIGQMFDAAYANLLARTESRPSSKGLADYIDGPVGTPTPCQTWLSDEPRVRASGAVTPRVMSVDRGRGAIEPSRANSAGFASTCRRRRRFATARAPPPFLPVPTRRAPRHSSRTTSSRASPKRQPVARCRPRSGPVPARACWADRPKVPRAGSYGHDRRDATWRDRHRCSSRGRRRGLGPPCDARTTHTRRRTCS